MPGLTSSKPPSGQWLVPISPSVEHGSLSSDTLLIPAVSIGSVPQLAFDLLVHDPELALQRIAHVGASRLCLPFVGPVDYLDAPSSSSSSKPRGLCTAIELYRNASHKVTLLHQRSPVIKSQKSTFVQELLAWIEEQGFKEVLLVGSMDAGMRIDREMETPLVQWSADAEKAPKDGTLAGVLKSLPRFTPAPLAGSAQQEELKGSKVPALPGAGLVRRILSAHAQESSSIALGALLMFCGEGDNRGDAHALAGLISHLLGVQESKGTS
jgi:PAC2 family